MKWTFLKKFKYLNLSVKTHCLYKSLHIQSLQYQNISIVKSLTYLQCWCVFCSLHFLYCTHRASWVWFRACRGHRGDIGSASGPGRGAWWTLARVWRPSECPVSAHGWPEHHGHELYAPPSTVSTLIGHRGGPQPCLLPDFSGFTFSLMVPVGARVGPTEILWLDWNGVARNNQTQLRRSSWKRPECPFILQTFYIPTPNWVGQHITPSPRQPGAWA